MAIKVLPLKLFSVLFALVGCLFLRPAATQNSYDWMMQNARVAWIEATYMPTAIPFGVDVGAGSCPVGATLRWNGWGADAAAQQANVKAVYAALVAAKLSGATVRIYGSNTGCAAKFVYLE